MDAAVAEGSYIKPKVVKAVASALAEVREGRGGRQEGCAYERRVCFPHTTALNQSLLSSLSSLFSPLSQGYKTTDAQLIRSCMEVGGQDYTSCTSVTAVILGDLLSVAHLGDSKIVLGREMNGVLVGRYLTMDHKPDQPAERARIEKSGGSLAYLHGGKPFIRGGDFSARQAKGERPMQLNYSRAFGGKDLKMFGLSAEPDIQQIQLTRADR